MRNVSPKFVYRLFYPQVPTIICAKHRNEVAGMPANSCIPVSDNPPLVSVAINKKSRTNKIMSKASHFSLNWIDYEDKEISKSLALPMKGVGEDKLKDSNVSYYVKNGVPILKNCRAYAICKVEKKIRTGDHDLFIASLIQARASRDFNQTWRFKEYRPLLYLGSESKIEYTTL